MDFFAAKGRVALPAILCGWTCGLAGCAFDIFSRSTAFDSRPLTLQTISLFNQRTPSRLAKRSWKGDWIFRRDRLELIDQELKNTKPDVLLLQEMVEKIGSSSESDWRILAAGSLSDYEWRQQQVDEYADTQETEALAVAALLPAKFSGDSPLRPETWVMGKDGYLMATSIDYEDQPVTVFDVQMPAAGSDNSYLWYSFVQERILDKLKKQKRCAKRLVVGGYLPGDENARRFAEFVGSLQLKDVSSGFCQIASRCYTATPTNDMFMATVGDESPTRTDRIFVHQSAFIYTSARNFEESDASNHYARDFGLTRLWPTQRFGWVAQVRLARCRNDELEHMGPDGG